MFSLYNGGNLIARGPYHSTTNDKAYTPYTPLQNGVKNLDEIKKLIKHGAKVNEISPSGSTALDSDLWWPRQRNCGDAKEVVTYLRSLGAKRVHKL